jgi:type II secretory pathway pseudopilin PulG
MLAGDAEARERGFLLIELLMVIVFLAVIFGVFAVMLSTTVIHNGEISAESALQTELRAAADSMAAEIRQAYTGDDTWYPIESLSSTTIQFITPDRATPFHVRRVAYRVNGGKLERAFTTSTNTAGPPWTWSGGGAVGAYARLTDSIVNTDVLTYQDAAKQATTDPKKVRRVIIKLVISPKMSGGKQITYVTSAAVRQSAS